MESILTEKPSDPNGLLTTLGSAPLDGAMEFEIVVTDASMMKMSVAENRELVKCYEALKAEAIRKGWIVEEYIDPRTQEHAARFTPQNIEGVAAS
tara:strand:+ start:1691 stop:1975 length:285 start_codon:yes stop_codon:yes gene_type:complete